MPTESTQKKLGRIRPPRVHITYDVEIGDAIEKRELPFVVGVLADLSGQPEKALPRLQERKFFEVDRDNIDQVMARQAPRLAFQVNDKLSANPDSTLGVELTFKSREDFRPDRVAEKIEPLRELMELRKKLSNLQNSLYGNDKLEGLLQQAVENTPLAGKPEEKEEK